MSNSDDAIASADGGEGGNAYAFGEGSADNKTFSAFNDTRTPDASPIDPILVGDAIARTTGTFGLFKNTCTARVAGTLESVSSVTGQIMIRGKPATVQVQAYHTGLADTVLTGTDVALEPDVTF